MELDLAFSSTIIRLRTFQIIDCLILLSLTDSSFNRDFLGWSRDIFSNYRYHTPQIYETVNNTLCFSFFSDSFVGQNVAVTWMHGLLVECI